eukprot:2017318-Rhodomonas_salina.2
MDTPVEQRLQAPLRVALTAPHPGQRSGQVAKQRLHTSDRARYRRRVHGHVVQQRLQARGRRRRDGDGSTIRRTRSCAPPFSRAAGRAYDTDRSHALRRALSTPRAFKYRSSAK